jgi:two-component system phosphate regulon response regulator PhoB
VSKGVRPRPMGMRAMQSEPEHILVVEDYPAHRDVVAFNLQKAGFRVTTASNGAEALERAQRERFDLIITDYFMPHQTGADLIRTLRQTNDYAHTPIILLTAKARELNLPRLANSLSILVASKSCSISRLMGMVASCLATHRCER